MRIEFWLDFICPMTYLTHKNLTEAIKELGLQNYEFYYRSFQVKEADFSGDVVDLFLEHHCNQSKESNIKFLEDNFPNYRNFKFYNTNLAHQLSHLSKHQKKAVETNTAIFEAYFEDGLDISNKDVLMSIAKNVGLDLNDSEITLDTRCYTNQIAINKENASGRGIVEIPHIRVNVKNNYNGYLSKEEIKNTLIDIINKKGVKFEVCGELCEF
ncbi:MAG TPA: DsbA family protein [Haploplasma sp.]|nr:DsbA family protein [Haploplasma sp.]